MHAEDHHAEHIEENAFDKIKIATAAYSIQSLVWLILGIASLYVTFKCKGDVSLMDIVLALCCGPCYLVYALYLLFDKKNNGCGLLKHYGQ